MEQTREYTCRDVEPNQPAQQNRSIVMSHGRLPRGAIASPRHKLAAATPHIITGVTPPNRIYVPAQLSFWGNNQYGDCVTAEEAFAKACYLPEILISDQTALGWASQHGFLNG